MLSEIRNDNIKKLIKELKKYRKFDDAPADLRNNLFMELRFAKLIITKSVGFKVIGLINSKVYFIIQVFTDLSEFYQSEEFEPKLIEFFDFEEFNDPYNRYLEINDYNKVPMEKIQNEIYLEKSYNNLIEKYSHHYSLTDTIKLIESFNNDNLIKYLNERKFIRNYNFLFEMMEKSVLFVKIDVEHQSEPVLLTSQTESGFHMDDDNYITAFTDLNPLKNGSFSVVDWFELIRFVICNQIDGIKIDTATEQIKLPRHQLLMHFDEIREISCRHNLSGTFEYIFKADDFAG